MLEAGRKVHNFIDWKKTMIALADKALQEERVMNAAVYYRGAEFYIPESDPDKLECYSKFHELFYRAFAEDGIEPHTVPYGVTFIPAIQVPPIGDKKGIILMHGGFDSCIEEFYAMMRGFADQGYEVIGFDGPGQGGARRTYDLAWDIEWEKPVESVLDYFGYDNAILYGLSMGGWLCLRAAAFEPRINRVIASGHAYDYWKAAPAILEWLMKLFFRMENFMRKSIEKKMQRDLYHNWFVSNAMYITKNKDPLEALKQIMQMTEENMHPERITQDVLILSGENDHFIPIKMHEKQLEVLRNARSVTGRVFTKEEHADNHCQIGNIGLAIRVVLQWLDEIRVSS
jgi:pimeloyl-ACP methyl ester carboxylesterase